MRWSGRPWPSCRRPCPRPSGRRTTWSRRSAPRWSARWRRPSGRRLKTRSPWSTSRRTPARWGPPGAAQGKASAPRVGLAMAGGDEPRCMLGQRLTRVWGGNGSGSGRPGTWEIDWEPTNFCPCSRLKRTPAAKRFLAYLVGNRFKWQSSNFLALEIENSALCVYVCWCGVSIYLWFPSKSQDLGQRPCLRCVAWRYIAGRDQSYFLNYWFWSPMLNQLLHQLRIPKRSSARSVLACYL